MCPGGAVSGELGREHWTELSSPRYRDAVHPDPGFTPVRGA